MQNNSQSWVKFIYLTLLLSLFVMATTFGQALAQEDQNEEARRRANPQDIPRERRADLRQFIENRTEEDRRNETGDKDSSTNERGANLEREQRGNAELDESNRERREVKREVVRNKVAEKRNARIRAYLDRILNRYEAAIERLDRLATRIDSRATKFEERGVDVSATKEALREAIAKMAEAKQSLEELPASAEDALVSENPKESFARVKRILNESKSIIKESHQRLVEAIRVLKASDNSSSEDDEQ